MSSFTLFSLSSFTAYAFPRFSISFFSFPLILLCSRSSFFVFFRVHFHFLVPSFLSSFLTPHFVPSWLNSLLFSIVHSSFPPPFLPPRSSFPETPRVFLFPPEVPSLNFSLNKVKVKSRPSRAAICQSWINKRAEGLRRANAEGLSPPTEHHVLAWQPVCTATKTCDIISWELRIPWRSPWNQTTGYLASFSEKCDCKNNGTIFFCHSAPSPLLDAISDY